MKNFITKFTILSLMATATALILSPRSYAQVVPFDQPLLSLEPVNIKDQVSVNTSIAAQFIEPSGEPSSLNQFPSNLANLLMPVLPSSFSAKSGSEALTPKAQAPEVPNLSAQVPEVPSTSDSAGEAPSLQPQPVMPSRQRFQPKLVPLQRRFAVSPSITILTPSAYGKSWGSASVGLGFQAAKRFQNGADGAFGVGFGLGDARKAVGLDVGVSVFDLSGFERGAVSFKLHRLLPEDFAIAAGVKNAIDWGKVDGKLGPYGVVTKRIRLKDNVQGPLSLIYLSAGAGGGQFRSETDVLNKVDTVGFFGSVAVRVVEPVNVIAEWSGQDLSMGLSFAPWRNLPLVITPAVSDITGNAGNGVRFVLGVGYGFSF